MDGVALAFSTRTPTEHVYGTVALPIHTGVLVLEPDTQ